MFISIQSLFSHDDVIKWKHFPRYWPFVRGIHRSPVNSPHKGQWRGALMFSLICARINGLVNNGEAGDLIRHRAHYDVIVMLQYERSSCWRIYNTERRTDAPTGIQADHIETNKLTARCHNKLRLKYERLLQYNDYVLIALCLLGCP